MYVCIVHMYKYRSTTLFYIICNNKFIPAEEGEREDIDLHSSVSKVKIMDHSNIFFVHYQSYLVYCLYRVAILEYLHIYV